MKKLIVNADDFGLTRSITDGIVKGARNGIVRSASFIVNTDAFEYAVEQANKNPGLDIGIHIAWVGEDSPVGGAVNSLTGNGTFYPTWRAIILNRIIKKIKLKDIEIEARAQIEKLLKSGIQPTHIDSHQHLHLFPGFSEITIRLAREYKIPFIRCPEVKTKRFFFINYLSWRLRKIIGSENFPESIISYGFDWGGRFSLKALEKITSSLYYNISELMVHPGYENEELHNKYTWRYNWQKELDCMLSAEAKRILQRNNVELTTYREVKQGIKI